MSGQAVHGNTHSTKADMRNVRGKLSSKDRPIDEHAALKAAQDLIRAGGPLNLKMKNVADRCGCSPGIIYRHFPSKDDLLAALLILEMRRRNDLYRKLASCRESSRRRMLGVLSAGFIFEPGGRRPLVKNWMPAVEPSLPSMSGQKREALRRLQEDMLSTIRRIVNDAFRQGEICGSTRDPEDVCRALLILMRGGQLLMEAPAFMGSRPIESPQNVMFLHCSHILNGLGWQPVCHPADCDSFKLEIEQLVRSISRSCL